MGETKKGGKSLSKGFERREDASADKESGEREDRGSKLGGTI